MFDSFDSLIVHADSEIDPSFDENSDEDQLLPHFLYGKRLLNYSIARRRKNLTQSFFIIAERFPEIH